MTAEAIAERFGISIQRANSRVRRMEGLRLVGTWQRWVCEPRAVFLTGRATELLRGRLLRARPRSAGWFTASPGSSAPWTPLFGAPMIFRIEPWPELAAAQRDAIVAAAPPLPLPQPIAKPTSTAASS